MSRDARSVPKSDESIPWEKRAVPPELGDNDAHVWFFPLIVPLEKSRGWHAILSAEETDRAQRFAFPYLRERYVAAHVVMRQLLGGYLNADPAGLHFEITERGKPSLPGNSVHFNLSHTQDAGLFAVTPMGEIGVDIERLDRKIDRHGIAGRFFSKAEAAELAALTEENQAEGFCNLWTRKEAWLKATGVGISDGLNKVEFNCRPGYAARLLRIDGDSNAAREWLIDSFRPPGDHVGAIAVRAFSAHVRYFCFAEA